jgi:integrase
VEDYGHFLEGKNWYIDYYYKGRQKRKKIGPHKKLAMQVLKDVKLKIAKGKYLGIFDEKKMLFEDYAKQYLDFSRINKSPTTYKRDRHSIDSLISFFKGKYLFEITPEIIEKYKAVRLEKVGPAALNRELACLKHMYTKAIEWGYVKLNPVKKVKLLRELPGRLRYLLPEEAGKLINACPGDLRPIVVSALSTVMRKSEILNLKWPQADVKNRKITIINAKNNESRVIPINQTLYQELSALPHNKKGGYVFTDKNGRPLGDIKKAFTSALKKAGIENFRFHDLRHTFASHLVMQGVNLKSDQQLMGHKDIKMTIRYSHLSPEYVQEAIEKLDNVWTPIGHQMIVKEKERDVTY